MDNIENFENIDIVNAVGFDPGKTYLLKAHFHKDKASTDTIRQSVERLVTAFSVQGIHVLIYDDDLVNITPISGIEMGKES